MQKNDTCIICIDDISNNNEIVLLKCFHFYHNDCFFDYIKYNLQKIKKNKCIECPTCRINTENKYILYNLLDKLYSTNMKIKELNKNKNTLSNNLLYINFKKCLWFKKRKELILEEEELMHEIDFYNKELYNINNAMTNLKKIYNNLII